MSMPLFLVIFGGMFTFVGAVGMLAIMWQLARSFKATEGVPVQECGHLFFGKLSAYAGAITIFGCGLLLLITGFLWRIVQMCF